jgi:hypothetical protein
MPCDHWQLPAGCDQYHRKQDGLPIQALHRTLDSAGERWRSGDQSTRSFNFNDRTMLTPEIALRDLRRYLDRFGIGLSPDAEEIIKAVEELGYSNDSAIYDWTFLGGLLMAYRPLRSAVIRYGGDPQAGVREIVAQLQSDDNDGYQVDDQDTPYSTLGHRGSSTRTTVIDLAISIARRNLRSTLIGADLLEALIDHHDRENPPHDNGTWADEALHTPYNTLAHIANGYHPSLWVRFADLRTDLMLVGSPASSFSPAENAPPEARSAVLMLLDEHPDFARNCFLIMPFRDTLVHTMIDSAVREILSEIGFRVLRADDRVYSEDLFTNMQAYIHACRFGVAVFERTLSDEFNPNVSLEVGYMLGQGKPVMLLKEQTIRQLHSDLVGRLYVPFDGMRISESLRPGMQKWLADRRLK